MYDSLRLTVNFLYGRVVQTRVSLSDSPFGSANQNKNKLRDSAQLRTICQTESLLWTITSTLKPDLSYLKLFLNFFLQKSTKTFFGPELL